MLKIYWDETVYDCENCVLKEACDRGELDLLCISGTYQIKDIPAEPEEPETEYEWKKKRLKFLKGTPGIQSSSVFMNEIGRLILWLEENKPKPKEKWERCTKENTKVLDEVRGAFSGDMYIVKYIFESSKMFVVKDKITGSDGNSSFLMKNYEINTAKEK